MQLDFKKDLDVVMQIYKSAECSDNYSKISRHLWQYCRDESNYSIRDIVSFKFKYAM